MCQTPTTPEEETKVKAEQLPYHESIVQLLEEAAEMGDVDSYCAYVSVIERTKCPEDQVDNLTQKLLDTQQILLDAVAAEATKCSEEIFKEITDETSDTEAAVNEAVSLAIASLTGSPPGDEEGEVTAESSDKTGDTAPEGTTPATGNSSETGTDPTPHCGCSGQR